MCDIQRCVCGWGYGSGKEYPGYRNALCFNSECSHSYQAEEQRKALAILSDPISTLECLPGNNEAPAKRPDLGLCS